MSLNLSEQLELNAGTLKPNDVSDGILELTHMAGLNAARDFNPNHKVFDTVDNTDPLNPIPINQDANQYLNKMLSATARMVITDSDGLRSLRSVMTSLIASEGVVTPSVIANATEAQWYGFINDNIMTALELFAGVKVQEKAEYDLL